MPPPPDPHRSLLQRLHPAAPWIVRLSLALVVLVALGGIGYFVVRRSLRPLAEVEETAEAIAEGRLHQRIPVREGRTEVGRLTVALNGMLEQIQTAFAATEASEESARRSEEKMRRFVEEVRRADA